MEDTVFLSQNADRKTIFTYYWKISCFEFFRDGKHGLFWAKKFDEKLNLIITEEFLFKTFRWWEIRSFFHPKIWWKDDIYLAFLSFPWCSRAWEKCSFVQFRFNWGSVLTCYIYMSLYQLLIKLNLFDLFLFT